ncbi:Putative hd domain-containing protein [Madurella fahalii]|uniref:Hd domain-containing protein n=1 Tax=Madurella fahalii TaxID=1157608 RepID=A0ABQ0GH25_9PEZI
MPPTPEAGYFQTLEHHSDNTITIHDDLYGSHTITEPILVALLRSKPLIRLSTVHQHGITGLLGLTPKVTRLEHSVGAFLLVRKVGSALDEQVAALLHDVSHTVLSHVIDWALSQPGEGSFHEVHKARYVQTTNLPGILAEHGFGADVLNEEAFPLVEQPPPHLCADRLDYGLRDAVGFGKLAAEDARRVFREVVAFPGPESPGRILVLEDLELALRLARAYLACDRDVWSNPRHIDMYQRAGKLIGAAVRNGVIAEATLWSMSDGNFWEALRSVTDDAGREIMRSLEKEGTAQENEEGVCGLGLPRGTKIRTLDPDVYVSRPVKSEESPPVCKPLSEWSPAWAAEREKYVLARQKLLYD